MFNLKKSATTVTLVALMSAAPMAAFAQETGSPQQSVESDPDETVANAPVTTDSVVDELETGTPAQSVEADESEAVSATDTADGTIADELPTSSPAVEEDDS
ncbi:MAG: hypothetical protein P1U53_13030 [Sulfitobacter sp.]|nr:hypothetical protein [Sulfitobacter sp.]